MQNGDRGKTENRTELILLSLVFTLPFLGAWLVYNLIQTESIGVEQLYGAPVVQTAAISDIKMSNIGAGRESGQTLHGKWSLVYYISGECGSGCRDELDMLRKLRLSAASNADKIQVVLVLAKSGENSFSVGQAADFNWSNISVILGEGAQEFAMVARSASGSGNEPIDEIYIINPSGELILRYGNNREGEGILNDLKHLLQNPDYSQK